MWWHDILLKLWTLTDKDTRTLSVRQLPEMVPDALRPELTSRIADAVTACKFAHRVRHNLIAHRNAAVATKVQPMPESSRLQIKEAIAALDAVFDFLHETYTGERGTLWEHLDTLGGSEYLLWILRRGLKARDEDIEQHRPPMRFQD